MSIVEAYIFKKTVNEVYSFIKKKLKEYDTSIIIKKSDFETILSNQFDFLKNWYSEITFFGIGSKKATDKVFVKLDYYLTPKKTHFSKTEKENTVLLDNILEKSSSNIVILGDPGYGKTTTLKYICYKTFTDTETFGRNYNFSILIRLKDISKEDFLVEVIARKLGVFIDESKFETNILKREVYLNLLPKVIQELNCLILLDGLDEVSDSFTKEAIINDLRNLSDNITSTSIVLTCRSGDYYYNLPGFDIYEIKPLNEKQIIEFIGKWLNDDAKTQDLYKKILGVYKYYAIKPLTLAHLCVVYNSTGDVPSKPIILYKKYVELLMSNWNRQNNVRRETKFLDFSDRKKLLFLGRIAYEAKVNYNRISYTKDILRTIYNLICFDFGLNEKDFDNVLIEIESQTGFLQQSGFDTYDFEHKTLQEYITSEFIVENKNSLSKVEMLPNELAAALLLDLSPNVLFLKILDYLLFRERFNSFYNIERVRVYNRILAKQEEVTEKDYLKYISRLNASFTVSKSPIEVVHYDFFNTFISRIAIERPDFEFDKQLVYWLLAIYTVSAPSGKNSQLSLFSLNTKNYLDIFFDDGIHDRVLNRIYEDYSLEIASKNVGLTIKEKEHLQNIIEQDDKDFSKGDLIWLNEITEFIETRNLLALTRRKVKHGKNNFIPNFLYVPSTFLLEKIKDRKFLVALIN